MCADKNLKILHVCKQFDPVLNGGLETSTLHMVTQGRKFGLQHRIFSLTRASPGMMTEYGISVFRHRQIANPFSCPVSVTAPRHFAALAGWADIIHYHYPWPFADLLYFLHGRHKPSVLTCHADITRNFMLKVGYQQFRNLFFDAVDAIIATSPRFFETSPLLQKHKNKVNVIPFGLNDELMPDAEPSMVERWRERTGDNFVLFIGSYRQYKGLEHLVAAVRLGGVRAVIVGGPADAAQNLREETSDIRENLIITGPVTEPDKAALLQLCRAVILPSSNRGEGFGMILLEGAYYGRALISTRLGTGTEYVNKDGETGLVVPAESPGALNMAMRRLCSEPETARRMGQAAKHRQQTVFSGMTMTQSYDRLYRSLVRKTAKTPNALPAGSGE